MKRMLSVTILFVAAFAAQAQTRGGSADQGLGAQQLAQAAAAAPMDEAERLRLAVSSIDYPVTPGDFYRLGYRESSGTIQQREFQVDAVSVLDMGVFGRINASGMTFYQLKTQVEEMIARNYTYSLPSFSIIAPGVFRVTVRDGSSRMTYESAWGLTRLSEIVTRMEGRSFSMRNVEVVSRTGRSERFDLLKSAFSSSANADPLLKSGDIVVLHGTERIVELSGEVRRPGRYELLDGENLRDLLEVFGGGLTVKAENDRVRVYRSTENGGSIEYVSVPGDYSNVKELLDGDSVVVGDKTAKQQLVWFEGAVVPPATDPAAAEAGASSAAGAGQAAALPGGRTTEGTISRFSYPYRNGIRLSDVLYEVRDSFLPTADLAYARLSGPGGQNPRKVDLASLLAGTASNTDETLEPGSIVYVPELVSRIIVSGAVNMPGIVPYRPGEQAAYYISRSGGFNLDMSNGRTFVVFDPNGQRRERTAPLEPGDTIYVKNSSFSYNFQRQVATWMPVISLALSVLTFGVSVGAVNF